MSDRSGRRWYVVQTHPNAEVRAMEHLTRQGFEAYLPRYRKQRRHARRIETVSAALFPRYLFVAFDIANDRWHCIRSTVGVTRLIGSEAGPVAVSNSIVDDIRNREDQTGLVAVQTEQRFRRGESVRLLNGVLSVCSGFFEGMTDNDRVAVLLDLLGRRVRVVVDQAAVAAA